MVYYLLQEAELRQHLALLRIEISHIRVVELTKQDISAYAYEVYYS